MFEHYLIVDALQLTDEYVENFRKKVLTLNNARDVEYLLNYMSNMLLELSVDIRLKAATAMTITRRENE